MNLGTYKDEAFEALSAVYKGSMTTGRQRAVSDLPAMRNQDLHHLHATFQLLSAAPKTPEAASYYIGIFQHIQMNTPEAEIARCTLFNALFPAPLPQASPCFSAPLDGWIKKFGPLRPIGKDDYRDAAALPSLPEGPLPFETNDFC